ncbi:outer membrane beta-barrel protein [Marivirga sp.]|uniref:outer membrane beta-barrel protein n=1 Tax=Marivirga sp. TaxID=2018662 RepID=UPI002D7F8FE4|nr:outer membrane beta-barrel protein [Marivirga sp.]HET8861489.1 outer membrane beta-barrel protein [Marivirga sp.]
MLSKINLKEGSRNAWSLYNLVIKSALFCIVMITGAYLPLQAQVKEYTKPSLWFGVAAGGNFNFYRGTTQELNADLTTPTAFRHGSGLGLFLAPSIEYYKPNSKWGVILQAGYDSRKGTFDRVVTPCDCPADLKTNLGYITVEPSLRFAPFKSGFYLFGGPRLAFNLSKDFTYQQGQNPNFPAEAESPAVEGEFSAIENLLVSMQIGAGYDIELSSQNRKSQFVLSPYASFHPYFGQNPRSIETWNNTTLRAGVVLKMGRGKEIEKPKETSAIAVLAPEVNFSVVSPENIPVERRVRETFPVLNYVFFNLGSTEIPERYVTLTKDQVKDFKEDQLEVFKPKKLSGRSERQMVAYYNVLNILGDRMGKNPSANITLVGSSEKGPEDAKAMGNSIKDYLVNIFGISPSRISVEGRSKAEIPSEQVGGEKELKLLRQEDRRVSIESSSPALLMEFQSGPNVMLKPVVLDATQKAPIDSYITFNNGGSESAFESWNVEVKEEGTDKVQNFGPYTTESVSIPGKSILGAKPEGDYTVTMLGKTKSGEIVRKESKVHMVLWTPDTDEQGKRYSVVYGFNDSKSIAMYEKYLTEIVTPQIPKNGIVSIHGYTDVIGNAENNQKLSTARAEDVKKIISAALSKSKRSDVTFKLYGFGENEDLSQFENKLPEERFYNRTVIIDIFTK